MSLTDLATIIVSTTGEGVQRAGFGVPMIVSHSAQWAERFRIYTSLNGVGNDFAANTEEYMAAEALFGAAIQVSSLVIGRAALIPTQQYTVGVQAAGVGTPYQLNIGVPTGVVFPFQMATYATAGATAWTSSGLWKRGDAIMGGSGPSGPRLYSCLGPSGAGYAAGFTGAGNAVQPSGIGGAIQDGQVFWMYAGSGATGGVINDTVIEGLKAAVEFLGAPTAVGTGLNQFQTALAGSQGARTLTLTANAGAVFFSTQVPNRSALNVLQSYADPGIATDLAAISLQNSSWYGLVTLFNSAALVEAAAAWVEDNTKIYPAASVDTQIATVALSSATDVAQQMNAQGYARSWIFFHPNPDEFPDAASLGRWLPTQPGSENWRMKTLPGVTAQQYSPGETTNFSAKNVAFYYSIGGVPVVGGRGKSAGGSYTDTVRGLDWYAANLQENIANLEIQTEKIPYTNAGIDLIAGKIAQMNDQGISAGLIAATPEPVIVVPDATQVDSADKEDRELNNVSTTFTLAGAIDHITVTVIATQ